MRGFLIVTTTVLLAIAIGVSVEWSNSSSLPSALSKAILHTMTVKSAEVIQTLPSLDSLSQTGTAIYNAPNLWEGAYSSSTSSSIETRPVLVGDSEYIETRGRGPSLRPTLNRLLPEPFATMKNLHGKSPAQQLAFAPMIDALQGSEFSDTSDVWTFHLDLGTATVPVTRGTITVSGKFVTQATFTEVIDGHSRTFSYRYTHLNAAPRIARPATARIAH